MKCRNLPFPVHFCCIFKSSLKPSFVSPFSYYQIFIFRKFLGGFSSNLSGADEARKRECRSICKGDLLQQFSSFEIIKIIKVIPDDALFLLSVFGRKTNQHEIAKLNVKLSKEFKVLPSPFLVNRAIPISVSLAFRCKHSERYSWGWPSGSTMYFTQMLLPILLIVKQGIRICHFQVF